MTKPARRPVILLLCCLATPLVFAQGTEPYHIKADVLGESMATFKQNHQDEKLECPSAPVPHVPAELKMCMTLYQPLTYAGEQASFRDARFADDKLYEISYGFDSSSDKLRYGTYYDRLLQPLIDKFGKPTETQDLEFPNLTGANLKNQMATWKNGVSTIKLERCAQGNPFNTMLTFSLDKLADDAARRLYKARNATADM